MKFGTFEKDGKMEEYKGIDNFNNVFRIHVLLETVSKLVSIEKYQSIFKVDITAAKLILHIIEGVCLTSLH